MHYPVEVTLRRQDAFDGIGFVLSEDDGPCRKAAVMTGSSTKWQSVDETSSSLCTRGGQPTDIASLYERTRRRHVVGLVGLQLKCLYARGRRLQTLRRWQGDPGHRAATEVTLANIAAEIGKIETLDFKGRFARGYVLLADSRRSLAPVYWATGRRIV